MGISSSGELENAKKHHFTTCILHLFKLKVRLKLSKRMPQKRSNRKNAQSYRYFQAWTIPKTKKNTYSLSTFFTHSSSKYRLKTIPTNVAAKPPFLKTVFRNGGLDAILKLKEITCYALKKTKIENRKMLRASLGAGEPKNTKKITLY